MKLVIDRPYVEALVERFPDLAFLGQQLKFGNRVEIQLEQLSLAQLDFLRQSYENVGPSMRTRAAQLSTIQKALADGGRRFDEDDLEHLVPGIAEFLIQNAVRGWLFKLNISGKPIAYLVSRIDFTPPSDEETGRILLDLKANSMAKITTLTLTLFERDIVGKTLPEILLAKGFVKETPELIQAYDYSTQRFFELRAEYGRQFSGRGTGIFAEDPTATHRNTDWGRKELIVLSSSGGWAKLVNDEEIIKDRDLVLEVTGDVLAKYLRKADRSVKYNDRVEKEVAKVRDNMPEGAFSALPIHGYILMFHLDLHHHLWVHVDDVKPYLYQPELKQKLILPPEQTDLIDILTAEMDVLMDDIVDGKSGGTTVLCAGPPGVGKTLTAEVYSEIIKRPLYRVHSGQLGLNVGEMEQILKKTLTRAQRWGAVMLIDEADVYIRRRDDNMTANAVVGVFLRVLEYFNGLLFLTTNRMDDIDEAVVSRCIALIRYHQPDLEDRRKIWAVMTEQFGLSIEPKMVDTLAELFPKASGRDIKGLAKLVSKYCHHKSVLPTLEVFERCSMFRGMDMGSLISTHQDT
ncbi:ATPase family protein associated with various cellular activities (AAA) [Azomonas agilis]|uniref:ATPase family protein associated with various cellular activities (AAA) n=1 Tax=Azomonas agilis TaxID=116849 RepID=A0A562I253_9GAMM|nr:ATP-binding protein [Azomonas agilis]TWH64896.1 ATPase family protein associated with various cellular activities (AAA) [Azomonas agilis]